jgi:hypothetical protein
MNMQTDPNRSTQDAFVVIDRLAPLLSLPGLEEKNKEVINEILNNLLVGVLKPAIIKTKASASGIIV